MPKIFMMALYHAKPEKVDEVRTAAKAFIAEVKRSEPATLFYEVYNGVGDETFFHVMTFEDLQAEERHRSTPHMARFATLLEEACTEPPAFVELDLVGSNVR